MKDLVRSDPMLGGMFDLNRFTNMFNDIEFEKFWKLYDMGYKSFIDLQPKGSFPKINVVETKDSYEVEIALAGFSKEDVALEFKDNCLQVKTNKKDFKDKKYLMREISYRSFKRVIAFTKKIDKNGIECKHENGVVYCVLKKEPTKPINDTIHIEIN